MGFAKMKTYQVLIKAFICFLFSQPWGIT